MTFPEDVLTAPARPAAAPSFIGGLLLNIPLPGAGFTLIGRWGWHLGWIGIQFVLFILAGVVSAATTSTLGLILPMGGFVAMLAHYSRVYAQQQARNFQPPLELAVKLVLILGHVFVGIFLTGILAAVLIPNLLGARQRAIRTAEDSVMHQMRVHVAAQEIDGTLKDGTCMLADLAESSRALITSCTVMAQADAEPRLDVTFTSGRRVQLP